MSRMEPLNPGKKIVEHVKSESVLPVEDMPPSEEIPQAPTITRTRSTNSDSSHVNNDLVEVNGKKMPINTTNAEGRFYREFHGT